MKTLEQDFIENKSKILIPEDSIRGRVRGLSQEIINHYQWLDKELIVVGLMDGASVFLSDLIRLLPFKIKLYFITLKTYLGKNKIKDGTIDTCKEFSDDFCNSIQDNNALIVDDILDTGESINTISEAIKIFDPKTLKTVVLLNKKIEAQKKAKADFIGFNIPDKFVVGFGMDYNGYYRNLPDIRIIE